jgi:hypothetical protein
MDLTRPYWFGFRHAFEEREAADGFINAIAAKGLPTSLSCNADIGVWLVYVEAEVPPTTKRWKRSGGSLRTLPSTTTDSPMGSASSPHPL